MAHICFPLPDTDFDVTEVAVPWKMLTRAGHRITFSTEKGATPTGDPLLLRGVLWGQLGADPEPKAFYEELTSASAFLRPVPWGNIEVPTFDALVLPGGHAPGMRQYLASEVLQDKVRQFFALGKPVGAICHGVLVAARAGALKGKKTTCLPKYMERTAYWLTGWKLGNYYRTYPAYVEDEVRAALADPADFVRGPIHLLSRGTDHDDSAAFVVEDGNYISARWPGDAYSFARTLMKHLVDI